MLGLLEKLEYELGELEKQIEENSVCSTVSDALPQELEERQALREKVRGALKQLEPERPVSYEAGQEHLHPADEDARVMQCKEQNRNAFAYNGQAVADEQAGIVLACEASTDCNDEQQLNAMLDKVEEQAGQRAERTLGDTGYATGPEFERAEKKERDVVVSLPQVMRPNPNKPYAASNFTYDKERDLLICPLGEELAFRSGHYRKDKGYHLRRYQCANTGCPHRAQCTKSEKGRVVELNQYHEIIKRQRDKQQLPAVRADLKKRAYLIEPVFAFIKQHLGFRRFTVSGLDNVQAQWAMMCTTYNLHKLFKHWKSGKNPPTSPGQTPKSALPTPSKAPKSQRASRYTARQRQLAHFWHLMSKISPNPRPTATKQKSVFV